MTEISTTVLSHVIVFIDGSTMDISEKAFESILSLHPDVKSVNLKGQRITLSSISKILTRQEFYEQYPDKKPPLKHENWTEQRLNGSGDIFTRSKGKGKEIMLRTLRATHPNSPLAKMYGHS